jgi:hypothetical protein
VVLDVDHPAAPEGEHLPQADGPGPTRLAPPQLDRHPLSGGGHDLGPGVGDPGLTFGCGDLALEDRPGLVGPVSARRSTPPQVAPRRAPPIELGVEECDERVDVTAGGGVEGPADMLELSGVHGRLPASG